METPADGTPPFDGDPAWRATRTLRDGTPITIRPIVPEDREELRRAYRTTSARTRYLRFLGSIGDLSDEMLAYLTCVDQKDHVALVATITSPDLKTERGVGIARFIRLPARSDVAEAAITVADDMQRKGVGATLAHELERSARALGVRTIRADVLEGNAPMRTILEEAGAKRVPTEGGDAQGTLTYDVELAPEPAPPKSLLGILRGAARAMFSSATTTERGDETEGRERET